METANFQICEYLLFLCLYIMTNFLNSSEEFHVAKSVIDKKSPTNRQVIQMYIIASPDHVI